MLRVVGAGLGRTGTNSLKLALERLLDGRCHHMQEVGAVQDPLWARAVESGEGDWGAIFEGYVACVDWPAAGFWRELAAANPDGAVLLSTRDSGEVWWQSFERTIRSVLTAPAGGTEPALARHREIVRALLDARFTPRWREREQAIAVYERHNEEVRAEVPAARLIEWQPGDGWEPICARLGVAVPDEPFPHENTTSAFRERAGLGEADGLTRGS